MTADKSRHDRLEHGVLSGSYAMTTRRVSMLIILAMLVMVIGHTPVSAQEAAPPQPEGAPPPPAEGAAPAPPEGAPPPPPEGAPPPPPGQSAPAQGQPQVQQGAERTPPRLSFTSGEVSFWRAGAEDC